MKTIFARAIGLALLLTPAWATAQIAGSVKFPAGYAPGQSVCVAQSDGTCTPVSTTNPLPVSGGAGGGGGDASAANQTTQIAAEQAIQAAIGAAAASPAANTIGDRLKTGNTSLASIDTDIGATTDSAAASDTATASLIALMKRNNQNLTTLNSSATPSGTNIIGRVGIDQTTPGTTNAVVATGNVASAATDSGNPVKIGGVYRATLPTFTDGQRADLQIDSRGSLRVFPVMQLGAASDAVSNSNIGFGANPGLQGAAGGVPASAGFNYNGSTWDRLRKPSAVARLVGAAASTNATSVKTSAGDVTNVFAWNPTGAVKYLKFYNKASAPTVGTDTPFLTIPVLPSSFLNLNLPNGGLYFSTGIAFAITGSGTDADTTAVAAGDIVGLNIVYQ